MADNHAQFGKLQAAWPASWASAASRLREFLRTAGLRRIAAQINARRRLTQPSARPTLAAVSSARVLLDSRIVMLSGYPPEDLLYAGHSTKASTPRWPQLAAKLLQFPELRVIGRPSTRA